jgi:hypothetical protein
MARQPCLCPLYQTWLTVTICFEMDCVARFLLASCWLWILATCFDILAFTLPVTGMNLLRMTGIPSRRGVVLPSSLNRRPILLAKTSATATRTTATVLLPLAAAGGGSSNFSGSGTAAVAATTTASTTTTTTRLYSASSSSSSNNNNHGKKKNNKNNPASLSIDLNDLRGLESTPEASARGQEALRLLPSYLADARAIPIHSAAMP